MNFCGRRFNLYFVPAVLLLLLAAGCALMKREKEPVALLRVHLESESSLVSNTQTISVMRSQPVLVNIGNDPILTEADIVAARVLDTAGGGFAVEVKFDETGSWSLEQSSAANPGKHLAIFGQWSDQPGDGRWLAAPLIARRIASGTLTFTPDASREEMEQLVKGLNEDAKKNAGMKSKE